MASTSSTATGRSVSCSGVWWWEIETSGPHGMTAKLMKAIVPDITGAAMNNSLSRGGGVCFFLGRQLERIRDRLEQPERPGPVRARPVLHPPDDPPLGPDHED